MSSRLQQILFKKQRCKSSKSKWKYLSHFEACIQNCYTVIFAIFNPIEAEDIKKRWQEYTEKLYKKDLHDPDNHNSVITHREPEVKWTLESNTMNKASGCDGIPVELFQSLKGDAVNMPANLENSAVATGLEEVTFHSNPNAKECSNYHTIALISHTSKVMLKILQARLQQYMNHELPDVQADFRRNTFPPAKCNLLPTYCFFLFFQVFVNFL